MSQRLKTAIFTQPYTVAEAGRGNQLGFKKPRSWIEPAVKKMWQSYLKNNNFFLFWSPTNTSKFQAAVIAGEAIPLLGRRLVLIHMDQLKGQHVDHLKHWIDSKYVKQKWAVNTIQGIYQLIERVQKTPIDQLDEVDRDNIRDIQNTCFVVLDELQKYTKGRKDKIKMMTSILDYMKQFNLKLVLGTTATGKHLKAIWEWAGTYLTQDKFIYRPSDQDLKKDGYVPVPIEYVWADQKTTYVDIIELEAAGIDIDDEKKVKSFLQSIDHSDINSTPEDLKNIGHDLNFRERYENLKSQYSTYLGARIDAALKHYKNHKNKGHACLIQVNGQDNALNAEIKYRVDLKKIGLDCVAWNSEAKNNHPIYKNDEKKLLKDVFDPAHPLKIIFVCGMLIEGTNKPFKNVYKTNFNHKNMDQVVQIVGRGTHGFLLVDATVMSKVGSRVQDRIAVLKKHFNDNNCPYNEDSLAKIANIWEIQDELNNNNSKEGQEKDTPINVEEAAAKSKGLIEHGQTIGSEKIWVIDVVTKGQVVTCPINRKNLHRSLPQKARSLIDVLGL